MIKKIKDWIYSDDRPFAKGLSFSKLTLIFVLGSFLGVVWENALGVVKRLIKFGKLSYRDHRGVIYGPFNPLYGIGIVAIIFILGRKDRSKFKNFIYGALLGGLTEYIASYLMEIVIGAKCWDYSDQILNINGRTSVGYMLFWGFGMMILLQYVYPWVSKKIEAIPKKLGDLLVKFFVIFLSIDIIISWTALGRQVLRHKGVEPFTVVGELYDKYYTDEFLKKIYVNMNFVK